VFLRTKKRGRPLWKYQPGLRPRCRFTQRPWLLPQVKRSKPCFERLQSVFEREALGAWPEMAAYQGVDHYIERPNWPEGSDGLDAGQYPATSGIRERFGEAGRSAECIRLFRRLYPVVLVDVVGVSAGVRTCKA
jgi:hypothetical protein